MKSEELRDLVPNENFLAEHRRVAWGGDAPHEAGVHGPPHRQGRAHGRAGGLRSDSSPGGSVAISQGRQQAQLAAAGDGARGGAPAVQAGHPHGKREEVDGRRDVRARYHVTCFDRWERVLRHVTWTRSKHVLSRYVRQCAFTFSVSLHHGLVGN